MNASESLPLTHRLGIAARALGAVFVPQLIGPNSGFVSQVMGAGTTPAQRSAAQLIQTYNELPWVRSIVNRISTSVANTEFYLEVVRKQGEPAKVPGLQRGVSRQARRKIVRRLQKQAKVTRIDEHPLLDVLAKPNFLMSGQALFKLVQIYIETSGQAFVLKQRNDFGMPVMLWPIPPNWIHQLPTNGSPYYQINIGARVETVPYTEVIWLRDLNPQNPFGHGSGTVKALDDELETDEYASRHVKTFFHNSARPDFLIYGDGIKSNNVEQYKQQWLQRHQGFWKSFMPHFVAGNISVHEFDQNFQQMQVVELRQFNRDICQQVWNMPPEEMGIVENSNRATISAADFLYNKNLVDPRMSLVRNELQLQLVIDYDDRLSLEYESPIDEDWEFKKGVYTAASWAFNLDEWRALAGDEEMPNGQGKVFMVPFGVTPTYLNGTGPAPRPSQDPEDPGSTADDPELNDGSTDEERGFISDLSHKSRFVDVEPGDESYRVIHHVADKFFNETWHKYYDAVDDTKGKIDMLKLEHALTSRNVTAVLDLLGLDDLRTALEGHGEIGKRGGLTGVYIRIFDLAARAEAMYLDQVMGKPVADKEEKAQAPDGSIEAVFNLNNPRAIQTIQQSVGALIVEINGGQRDGIRAIIEHAFEQALAPVQSAKLIRDIVGLTEQQMDAVASYQTELVAQDLSSEIIGTRVERYAAAQLRRRSMNIARTETINASSAGQHELWKQAIDDGLLPATQKRRWVVTPDDRLDKKVCLPMAGQEVGIDEPFITGDGRHVMKPTAHPQCRCSQRLVIQK